MRINELLLSKEKSNKEITEEIANLLISGKIPIDDYIGELQKMKGSKKATLIESMEYATKESPGIANESCYDLIIKSLNDKEPRVKWESARVIANVAEQFPQKIEDVIERLQNNIEGSGTVVRWSIATALASIAKTNYKKKEALIELMKKNESIEEKASIKKIYISALKVIDKK